MPSRTADILEISYSTHAIHTTELNKGANTEHVQHANCQWYIWYGGQIDFKSCSHHKQLALELILSSSSLAGLAVVVLVHTSSLS